eukprot:m.324452 g.324452  ORF g.324452 m.324452 type:complete len:150 (+) comp20373_c0_seq15:473-922(+)
MCQIYSAGQKLNDTPQAVCQLRKSIAHAAKVVVAPAAVQNDPATLKHKNEAKQAESSTELEVQTPASLSPMHQELYKQPCTQEHRECNKWVRQQHLGFGRAQRRFQGRSMSLQVIRALLHSLCKHCSMQQTNFDSVRVIEFVVENTLRN